MRRGTYRWNVGLSRYAGNIVVIDASGGIVRPELRGDELSIVLSQARKDDMILVLRTNGGKELYELYYAATHSNNFLSSFPVKYLAFWEFESNTGEIFNRLHGIRLNHENVSFFTCLQWKDDRGQRGLEPGLAFHGLVEQAKSGSLNPDDPRWDLRFTPENWFLVDEIIRQRTSSLSTSGAVPKTSRSAVENAAVS